MQKDYNGKFSGMSIAAFICSFFGCIGIAGIVLGIIDLTKKDGRKRGLAIAAIIIGAIMTIGSFAALGGSSDENKTTAEVDTVEENTMVADDTSTVAENKTEGSKEETPEESSKENTSDAGIELIAGETGEYGKELVLNEGTEFEDKTIGYFVPSGMYEVKNIGDHMTQVNVYKNEKKTTEEGWEEWADTNVELLDVNETKEMKVEEGYFFNIDEPSHILIKLLDSETSDDNSNTEVLREEFNSKLGETKPLWYESVLRDKTGNWRELVVYSNKAIDKDLACEYCKAYFNSDDEVHWVTNLNLKTVTRFNKSGNLLFVTTTEYRDGEENDANELGGGMKLDEFCVNLDTGELFSLEDE